MIVLQRYDSAHPHFIQLVRELDAFLAELDGEEHQFYNQLNAITNLRHVLVGYEAGTPVCCGAFRPVDSHSVEIKRMYTIPGARGKNYASTLLKALEQWASELSYTTAVLETGKRQPDAIALYEKNGYRRIDNYGQYAGIENSICFSKAL